ncbi:MAG: otopetrin domain-containing protein [Actinobacteria bacterium]|nr:otopetrin domain-containing protein [Actinomycetota bacterium]
MDDTAPTSVPGDSASGSRVLRAIKAAALVASAPVLAGALRVVYEEYYRALGTSVDEVGLSAWRMATFPMLIILLFVGTSGLALFAGASFFLWLERDGDKAKERSERRRVLDTVLSAVGAAGLSFLGFFAILAAASLSGRTGTPILVLLGGLVIVVFVYVGWDLTKGSVSLKAAVADAVKPATGRLLRLWFVLFLSVSIVLLATGWCFIWLKADGAARGLRKDGSTAGSPFTAILDIRPQPVCPLSSQDGAPLPPGLSSERPVLLLGSAGGIVVLRDVKEKVTFRVPSGELVLRSGSEEPTSCRVSG